MVFFPVNHIPHMPHIPRVNFERSRQSQVFLSEQRFANQVLDRIKWDDSLFNTKSKPIAKASTLATFANVAKVGYTIACTLARLVLVFLGFLILIAVYGIHKISLKGNKELSVSNAASSAIQAANVKRDGAEAIASNKSAKSVPAVKPVVPHVVGELRQREVLSRTTSEKRKEYFEYLNNNVDKIFSKEGMKENFGTQEKDVDAELLKLSHESYVNLTLVYRFDGKAMVGKTISLMHTNEEGKAEKVDYRVDEFFKEIVGYGLIPVDPKSSAPPRLIVRGTNNSPFVNEHGKKKRLRPGFKADLAKDIGKEAYEEKQKKIGKWLKKVTKNGTRKAFVSGHSLGGAFAQRVAADLSHLVGEVLTFCSPRVRTRPVIENQKMKINHVIMTGDLLVTRAGGGRFSKGAFLSGGQDKKEIVLISGGGHTSKMLSDYCLTGETPEKIRKISVGVQLKRDWFWSTLIDFIRPQVSIA